MKKLIVVLMALVTIDAMACFMPPAEQSVSDDELISRTDRIVLAIVTSANIVREGYYINYDFEVVRKIKGNVKKTFTIEGYPLHEGGMQTFNNHFEPIFWTNALGRESNYPDCEIHPAFAVGAIYLVFLDRPYHVRSFEQIIWTHGDKESKDKWLRYVEERVGLNNKIQSTR